MRLLLASPAIFLSVLVGCTFVFHSIAFSSDAEEKEKKRPVVTKEAKALTEFQQNLAKSYPSLAKELNALQVDKIRHDLDKAFAQLFRKNPVAKSFDLLVDEVARSLEYYTKLRLTSSATVAMGADRSTGFGGQSQELLSIYKDVMSHWVYNFTKEQIETKGRLFIVQGSTKNAYAFSSLDPMTTYYEGLLDATTPQQIAGVMAHELGHVQSGHVKMGIQLNAFLLVAGSYVGYRGLDTNSRLGEYILDGQVKQMASGLEQNAIMPRLSNPAMFSKIANMSELELTEFLNPLELSIVTNILHHVDPVDMAEKSRTVKRYLDSTFDLANIILQNTNKAGLENLILQIENLLIDKMELEDSMKEAMARAKMSNRPVSSLRNLEINYRELVIAFRRGMLRLSRSKENTADRYETLVVGAETSKSVNALLMGGNYANVEGAKRQMDLFEEEIKNEPERSKKALRSMASTHPSSVERVQTADKFVNSWTYRTIRSRFVSSLENYFDLVIFTEELLQQRREIANSEVEELHLAEKRKEQEIKDMSNRYREMGKSAAEIDLAARYIAEKTGVDSKNKLRLLEQEQQQLEVQLKEISELQKKFLDLIIDVFAVDLARGKFVKVELLSRAISEKVMASKNVNIDALFMVGGIVDRVSREVESVAKTPLDSEWLRNAIAGAARREAKKAEAQVLEAHLEKIGQTAVAEAQTRSMSEKDTLRLVKESAKEFMDNMRPIKVNFTREQFMPVIEESLWELSEQLRTVLADPFLPDAKEMKPEAKKNVAVQTKVKSETKKSGPSSVNSCKTAVNQKPSKDNS